MCLLLASSAVLAGDDDRVAQVERDIANIDTFVRMRAVGRVGELKNVEAQRRILVKLAHDPDPSIRYCAYERAVVWAKDAQRIAILLDGVKDPEKPVRHAALRAVTQLTAEDMERIPVETLLALLPVAAYVSNDHEVLRVISVIDSQINAGVAVSASSILTVAVDTRSLDVREAVFHWALRSTRVAPLSSDCVPVLTTLLADKDTRASTIDFLGHARGAVGFGLLLEIEATTTSDSERHSVQYRIEHHDGHAKELHTALLDAAKNAKDPRVRELAKKRLEDW
ncbi:MAG TPA: HEAT repeat domain-containing protein [Planctomycetota bacterium]|nr:HEAT repeat domain-containing protein [Planctomycetota bacterium]